MASIASITNADVRKVLTNMCLTKATLAINAGGAATVKTTGTTTYMINGVLYTKGAMTAQAITVTHDQNGNLVAAGYPAYIQPVNTTVYYVISLDKDGNVAVSQGSYVGQAMTKTGEVVGTDIGDGKIPAEPAGYTAIGVIKVAPTVAATFNPGTTLLDAANVNATYFDVALLPETL